jgi:hypothetical protein
MNTRHPNDSEPPDYLDGARVIKWAWSGREPFGYMAHIDGISREAIHGLAICHTKIQKVFIDSVATKGGN